MSALLRQQMMLMAQAVAAGITPIGSKATAQTLTFTTGQLSGNATFALPTGCAAGDVVTLTCLSQGVAGFAWVTPTNATVALAARTLGAYPIVVYTYTLTSADITAGSVTVSCTLTTSGSWSIPVVGVVDVDRGVSAQNIDVVGTFGSGSLVNGSNTCTAPGITTTLDGDLLRYCLFATPIGTSITVTPPTGYTPGDAPFTTNKGFATTGYLKQAADDATGNAVATVSVGFPTSDSWGMVLLSLRKKATGITLSATFPSSPHVGDAISFDVTATLVDGATGTPTINVIDPLPAGLSLGSTSMVDATHYKATVSGTLTTVQDITGTFGTTGGSPNATPLAHEFNVTAAATTITKVGTPVIFTATSGNLPLPTGCQAGDVLVIANRGAGMPAPSGFTTLLASTSYGTSGRHSAIFAKALTATDITNGYIAVSSNSNTCTATAWRGVDNTTLTNAIGTLGTGPAVSGNVVMVAPGLTTTVDGCMILFFGMPDQNSSGSGTFTPPSGYSDVADNFTTLRAHTIDSLLQTTHGATGDVTGTYAVSGTWPWGAILIALNPA